MKRHYLALFYFFIYFFHHQVANNSKVCKICTRLIPFTCHCCLVVDNKENSSFERSNIWQFFKPSCKYEYQSNVTKKCKYLQVMRSIEIRLGIQRVFDLTFILHHNFPFNRIDKEVIAAAVCM